MASVSAGNNFKIFYEFVGNAIWDADAKDKDLKGPKEAIVSKFINCPYAVLSKIFEESQAYKVKDREELESDAYQIALWYACFLPGMKEDHEERKVNEVKKFVNMDKLNEAESIANSIEHPEVRAHALAVAVRGFINSDQFSMNTAWQKIADIPEGEDKEALIQDLNEYDLRSTTPAP